MTIDDIRNLAASGESGTLAFTQSTARLGVACGAHAAKTKTAGPNRGWMRKDAVANRIWDYEIRYVTPLQG